MCEEAGLFTLQKPVVLGQPSLAQPLQKNTAVSSSVVRSKQYSNSNRYLGVVTANQQRSRKSGSYAMAAFDHNNTE